MDNWLASHTDLFGATRNGLFNTYFNGFVLEDNPMFCAGIIPESEEESEKFYLDLINMLEHNTRPADANMCEVLRRVETQFLDRLENRLTPAAKEKLAKDSDAFWLEFDKHLFNFFMEVIERGIKTKQWIY